MVNRKANHTAPTLDIDLGNGRRIRAEAPGPAVTRAAARMREALRAGLETDPSDANRVWGWLEDQERKS